MIKNLIQWLESGMGSCSIKALTGAPCPGCGLQRSFIALLKGNLAESILMYPALIPMMIMFVFLGLHLVFRFRFGAAVLKYLFIGNTAIIFLHYMYLLLH